jgi:signal transduction histidine kinase
MEWFRQLNLVRRYNLVAFLVMLLAMLVLGWWVGREIKTGIIHRASGDSALFVENHLLGSLQELVSQDFISEANLQQVEKLLSENLSGPEIVAIKIWSPEGKVIYGNRQGELLPIEDDLEEAFEGKVHAGISNLDDEENSNLKTQYGQLLEIYVPIRYGGTDRVIAVAEFYQTISQLQGIIRRAQFQSWLVVALVMLLAYALLVGIVRQGHRIIIHQQDALNHQVQTLNTLLKQNQELTERLRRASLRTTTHNERFLNRISSEIDDGPAQELSLSLNQISTMSSLPREKQVTILDNVYHAMGKAIQDLRNITSGLRLPELESLGISEIIDRVVRDHERRTRSFVEVKLHNLPRYVIPPIKATLFRLMQEGLSNAYRHGEGASQQIFVQMVTRDKLLVEVRDQGPGFDVRQRHHGINLGLSGMRERIESVGGSFAIHSHMGQGITLRAEIPLNGELYESPEVLPELDAVA